MINFPIGLLVIAISLFYFYDFNRRRRNKRIERQNFYAEKQEELIELLKEKEEGEVKRKVE